MSQAHVGIVIEALLADENLRIRFALNRIEAVTELRLRGVELTSDEVDLFCRTDASLWFLGDEVTDEWQHWSGTRDAARPERPTPDHAPSEEAILARMMDEIITRLAQRETRRSQA